MQVAAHPVTESSCTGFTFGAADDDNVTSNDAHVKHVLTATQLVDVIKNAADLHDPTPVDAEHVYQQLLRNYPPKSITWVRDLPWAGPVEIPLDRIDWAGEDSWAASHQKKRVNHFRERIRARGQDVNPVIGVQVPGSDLVRIIDGHHRALAYRAEGKRVKMYVGFAHHAGPEAPWFKTHLFQEHQGASKLNKITAGELAVLVKTGAQPHAGFMLIQARDADRKRRYLLEYRAEDATWGLPGGNGVAGETPWETAQREVREELDITLSVAPVAQWDLSENDAGEPRTVFLVPVSTPFSVDATAGDGEVHGWAWVKRKQVPSMELQPLVHELWDQLDFDDDNLGGKLIITGVEKRFNPEELRDKHGEWTITLSTASARKEIGRQLDEQGLHKDSPLRGVLQYNTLGTHSIFHRNEHGDIDAGINYTHQKRRTLWSHHLTIHDVRVLPQHSGIGTEMFRQIARAHPEAKDMGVHGAITSAIPFYEKLGAVFTPGFHNGEWDAGSLQQLRDDIHKSFTAGAAGGGSVSGLAPHDLVGYEYDPEDDEELAIRVTRTHDGKLRVIAGDLAEKRFNPLELRGPHGEWVHGDIADERVSDEETQRRVADWEQVHAVLKKPATPLPHSLDITKPPKPGPYDITRVANPVLVPVAGMKHNIELHIDGVDRTLQTVIKARVEHFANRYPYAASKLESMSLEPHDSLTTKNAMATAIRVPDTGMTRIKLSDKYFADFHALQRAMITSKRQNFHPLDTMGSVVDHELGHAVENAYYDPGDDINNTLSNGPAWDMAVTNARISEYARRNRREAFAEAFCVWENYHTGNGEMPSGRLTAEMKQTLSELQTWDELYEETRKTAHVTAREMLLPTCGGYVPDDLSVKSAWHDNISILTAPMLDFTAKVGPEGYIHGYICVRPPCGPKYKEAVLDKKKGLVLGENGEKIGRVPAKDGDGKYTAVHFTTGADGTEVREKLPARFDSPREAFAAIPVYHDVQALSNETGSGDVHNALENARRALASGDVSDAQAHLAAARDMAQRNGDTGLASHIDHVRSAVAGDDPVEPQSTLTGERIPGSGVITARDGNVTGTFDDLLSPDEAADLRRAVCSSSLRSATDEDALALGKLKDKFIKNSLMRSGISEPDADVLASMAYGDVMYWGMSGNSYARAASDRYAVGMSMITPPELRSSDLIGFNYLSNKASDMSPEAQVRRDAVHAYWVSRAQQHYTQEVLKEAGEPEQIPVSRYVSGDYSSAVTDAQARGESWSLDTRTLSSWVSPEAEGKARAFVKHSTYDTPLKLSQTVPRDSVYLHWRGEQRLRDSVKVPGEVVPVNVQVNSDVTQVNARKISVKPAAPRVMVTTGELARAQEPVQVPGSEVAQPVVTELRIPAAPQRVISHTQLDIPRIKVDLTQIAEDAKNIPGLEWYQNPMNAVRSFTGGLNHANPKYRTPDDVFYPTDTRFGGEHLPPKALHSINWDLHLVDKVLAHGALDDGRDKRLTPAGIEAFRDLRDRLSALNDEINAADTTSPFTPGEFTSSTKTGLTGSAIDHLSPDDSAAWSDLVHDNRLTYPENTSKPQQLAKLKGRFIQSALQQAGLPENAAYVISGGDGDTGDWKPGGDGVEKMMSDWSVQGGEVAAAVSDQYEQSMKMTQPPEIRVTDFAGAHYEGMPLVNGSVGGMQYSDMSPEAQARRNAAMTYWVPRAQQHYTSQVLRETGKDKKPLKITRYVYGGYADQILTADHIKQPWTASTRALSSWADAGKGSASAKSYVTAQSGKGSRIVKLTKSVSPGSVFYHWRGESTLRNYVKALGEIVPHDIQVSSDDTTVEDVTPAPKPQNYGRW